MVPSFSHHTVELALERLVGLVVLAALVALLVRVGFEATMGRWRVCVRGPGWTGQLTVMMDASVYAKVPVRAAGVRPYLSDRSPMGRAVRSLVRPRHDSRYPTRTF